MMATSFLRVAKRKHPSSLSMAPSGPSKGDYGSLPVFEPTSTASVELARPSLKNALIAEFFGTAILVQVGCGGLCVSLYLGNMSGMFQIGAVWALGATLAIYCTAAISGGHLNPAVTLAFCLVRRDDFPIRNVLPYWMAQLVGSMLAAGINLTMFHVAIKRYERKHGIVRGSEESIASAAGAFGNYWSLNKGVSGNFHAFFMEAFATAFLCFIIFAATHAKNPLPSAAVAPVVGTAFGMMVCIFGGLTGAALNPARDLGPRLVTLMAKWGTVSMTNSVVYIVGPLVGGPVGAFCADKILMID